MQRKFILNLILLLALNLLVKPFYILAIDAEVLDRVRASSEGSYGQYASILSFTILLNIILDFGIVNFNTRNLAQNKQLLTKHFSGIFTLRIGLAAIYFLVALGLGWLVYDPNVQHLLWLLALNQIIIAFILYFRSVLSGLLLFSRDSFISVLDRILLIAVCSTMLWGGLFGEEIQIEWFVYAQTASYALSAIVAFFFVLPHISRFRIQLNRPFAIMILKKSFPFALLIILMTAYYRSDTFMLERMSGEGAVQAELYSMGYRIFEALNMVVFMFAGMLLPIFSKQLKEKIPVEQMLILAIKLLFTGGVIVGITCFFYSDHLVDLRYAGNTPKIISQSFGMLMLSFFSICATFLFSTLLTASGKLKELNITAAIGLIVNVVLNVVLIPRYQAYGAAMASFFTQLLTGICQIAIVQKHFRFNVNVGLIARMFLLLVLAFGLGYLLRNKIDWQWKYEFLLLGGTLGIVSMLTGLFNPKKMFEIIRYNK